MYILDTYAGFQWSALMLRSKLSWLISCCFLLGSMQTLAAQSSAEQAKIQDYLQRGNRDGAIRALTQASSQVADLPDTADSVATLRQMADQYLALGARSNAVSLLTRSIVIAKKVDPTSVDGLLQSLGNTQGEADDHLAARETFRQLLAIIPADKHRERALAYTNLLKAEVRSSDEAANVAAVVAGFKEELRILGSGAILCQLGLPFAGTLLLSEFAADHSAYLDWLLTASLKSARDANNQRDEIYAIGFMAKFAGIKGDNDRSLALAREALTMSVNSYPDLAYRWQWQIGRIKARQGQREAAINDYLAAIDTLSGIQSELLRGSYTTFHERVLPAYNELIDLLLAEADVAATEAKRQALLLHVQQTIEALNKSEILDYFDDDCLLPTEVTQLKNIAADTVVIYPIVLNDRLVVVSKFADGIHQTVSMIDRETLAEYVAEYRESIDAFEFSIDEIQERSARLYKVLLAPIEGSLKSFGIKRLVFIPSAGFRTIPMAALYDGNQYLIENYEIATTLGLGLTDPRPLQNVRTKPLLGGVSESVQGFVALPGVVEEIEDISETLGGDVILNEDFSLANVAEKLGEGGYSIVHLATHGVFDSEASNSYLLAFDQKLTLDRLQDTVGNRRFLGDPLDLLVLSACETAAGNERAALGLAGVTLKAGARSTIATLWPISDEATSKLMANFYIYLKSGMNKSAALRKAQLDLVQNPQFDHPNFWSPFLLIGNWL